jgi:cell volume regulation protein A
MNLTTENILLLGSLLLFISIVASKTSYRIGVPTLLLFLGIGVLAGYDGFGGIHFDNPKVAQFIGIVAMNFILFLGGLETKFESVRPILWRGVSLSTIGVFVTAMVTGVFVSYLSDFTLLEGLLLGAIVSSTDAAAVFSVLRSKNVGLKQDLRPTLELESGSNDPMAYVLTIGFTYLITHPEASFWQIVPMFFQQMMIGALGGYCLGNAMLWIVNRIHLDFEGLYPVLIISLVFLIFSFVDFIGGNGFLAIYMAGLIMGNNNFIHKKSIIRFYDGMSWLMQIVMFLTLGLLVYPKEIIPLLGIGVLIAFFLMLVARTIAVFVSLSMFKNTSFRKKIFVSWVGLRGAAPIVFATYPLIAGVEKAGMIFNLVFFISITSVALQGTTLSLVAKWLKLALPSDKKPVTPLDLELSDNVKSALQEVIIEKGNPFIGKKIVELKFPKTALIVLVNRNEQYIMPNGATVIHENDRIMIMAENENAMQEALACLGV